MSNYNRARESSSSRGRNPGIFNARERGEPCYNPRLSSRPVPEFIRLLDMQRGPLSGEIYYRNRQRREELKRQVLNEAFNAVHDLAFLVEQEVHDCSPYRGRDCVAGDILPLLENQMLKFQEMRAILEIEAEREYMPLF